ncbi:MULTISPECIES: LCP family protein [Terrabacter]|uniref:LCP family protein n=1 Tax=Terrabacter TaxID=53355 RepID=UPI0004C10741|nr:LCP family protein [Terrabacter tumescens]WVM98860.1 LCP family protein [Terrabacter sp. C0L_2]
MDSTRERDADLFERDETDGPDGADGGSGGSGDDWDGGAAADGGSGRREKKRNRKVLVAALVLLLVPVLAVGGYLAWLNHIVTNNVKQELLLPDSGTDSQPTDKNGNVVAQPTGSGTNYLIIGNDAGPDRVGARSDVMVLVHVPEDHSQVTLIHFPRDLYVSIPGKGKNKLNAAYAFGGAPLLVKTMQNMLGIRIDHVAMQGFEGFKAMTDAVGGVDVDVEEPSKDNGYDFTVGTMHMTGDMALAFVRERKQLSEGDISRGRRQLAFIKALMLKTLNKDVLLNPVRLSEFADAATKNLTVDQKLDVGTMRSEAFALRDLRGGDIRFITAPFTGFGTSPQGASIDIVDEVKMADLGEAIRNDELASYK